MGNGVASGAGVGIAVDDDVAVGAGVGVAVGVGLGVAVGAGVESGVAVGVGLDVAAGKGLGVAVGGGVGVGRGVGVIVGVGVGRGVAVAGAPTHSTESPPTACPILSSSTKTPENEQAPSTLGAVTVYVKRSSSTNVTPSPLSRLNLTVWPSTTTAASDRSEPT